MKPPIYQGMDVPSTTPEDIFDLLFAEHVDNSVDSEEEADFYNEDDRPLNFERD